MWEMLVGGILALVGVWVGSSISKPKPVVTNVYNPAAESQAPVDVYRQTKNLIENANSRDQEPSSQE